MMYLQNFYPLPLYLSDRWERLLSFCKELNVNWKKKGRNVIIPSSTRPFKPAAQIYKGTNLGEISSGCFRLIRWTFCWTYAIFSKASVALGWDGTVLSVSPLADSVAVRVYCINFVVKTWDTGGSCEVFLSSLGRRDLSPSLCTTEHVHVVCNNLGCERTAVKAISWWTQSLPPLFDMKAQTPVADADADTDVIVAQMMCDVNVCIMSEDI